MLNHSDNFNVAFEHDDEGSSFVIRAVRDIKKGEELFNNYGDKNSVEMLLHYGFMPENRNDLILPFNLILNPTHTKYEEKLKMIAKGTHSRAVELSMDISNPNVVGMVSYMRFLQYDGSLDFFSPEKFPSQWKT
jgi:hypothetical protein